MRWVMILIAFCLAVPVVSQETVPATVRLVSQLKPGGVSRYTVKVRVTGNTIVDGSDQPVDSAFDIEISHRVGQPATDRSIQLVISAERAWTTINDQKIELAKDIYPNITVLFDGKGDVARLLTGQPSTTSPTGLNYRNMILLFRTYAPNADLKVGDTWKKAVILPPEPEKYELLCTLQAIEDIDGVRTARVRTDIKIIPAEGATYTAKGFAVTNFSLDSAKLIKSHAETVIKVPKSAKGSEAEATVKIDISATK